MNYKINIFSSLIIGMILLASCQNNDLEEIARLLAPSEPIVHILHDVEMTYSDSAIIRVVLTAPLNEKHETPSGSWEDRYPEGIKVVFLNKNGEFSTVITAKSAIRYEKEELIVASDSVVLISAQADTFRTEQLFWDQKKGRLYNYHPFKYTKPGELITGYGWDSDERFENFSFKNMAGYIPGEQFEAPEPEESQAKDNRN